MSDKKYKINIVITTLDRTSHSRVFKSDTYKNNKYQWNPENYIEKTIYDLMEYAGGNDLNQDEIKISIYESGSNNLDYLNNILKTYPQIELIEAPGKASDISDAHPCGFYNLMQNTNRALLGGSENADYVLLIQDDVEFSKNALFKIETCCSNLSSNVAFITFFNGGSHDRRQRNKSNLKQINANSFWGNYCLLFNSNSIENLLSWLEKTGKNKRSLGHDMVLKSWAANNKKQILMHTPLLVNHVGLHSTLSVRAERSSKRFKKNYNAFPNKRNTSVEKSMTLKNKYSKLGTKKKAGSSVKTGKAYHELPFKDENRLPTHRKNLKKRTSVIKKQLKVKDKYGIDLGCSVGGFVFDMQLAGAKMIGIDYDQQAIDVGLEAEKKYKTGANFICSDINLETYKEALKKYGNPKTGKFDFCIWYSQFMWMVKSHGKEKSIEFMKYLSETCDTLFFETSEGDKAAGKFMKKMGVTGANAVSTLLKNNSYYNNITNLGPSNDGWSKRNIFICKNPVSKDERKKINLEKKEKEKKLADIKKRLAWKADSVKKGVTSKVEIFLDKNLVRKTYKKGYEHCLKFETNALKKLNKLDKDHFPTLEYEAKNYIELSFAGDRLSKSNLPKDYKEQINHILSILKKADIVNRDIKPDNLHVKNDKIVLIDFGWAESFKNIKSKPSNSIGLGHTFKHPKKFDDEFSLNKSINHLLK
jgi:hypothetical protein